MALKKKLSAQEQREAQKQAKQKKILLILAPILLIAVAIQVPRLLGGEEEAAPTETTATDTAGASAPAPAGGAEAPEPSAAPASDPLADPALLQSGGVAVSSSVRLAEVSDSDPLAPVEVTELVSFSSFAGSDPFVQLVEPESEAEPEREGDNSGAESGEAEDSKPADGEPAVTALAILEVNGVQEVVAVAASFPADDPAFKLIAIQGTESIEFGLVEGSFSSGIETLDLDVGKSITLVSQPDGFRYTIRLVQIAGDGGGIEVPPSDPNA